jgi:hypothetical protein
MLICLVKKEMKQKQIIIEKLMNTPTRPLKTYYGLTTKLRPKQQKRKLKLAA